MWEVTPLFGDPPQAPALAEDIRRAVRGTYDAASVLAHRSASSAVQQLVNLLLLGGHIVWLAGAVMALGQLIGGNLGARLILRHGTGLIKPLLVVMSLAMSARLILL